MKCGHILLTLALAVPVFTLLYRYWALGYNVSGWGEDDIKDLTGKVAIVTGANMGLGFETARQLAEHGAKVVLGCRSMAKCEEAKKLIQKARPSADVTALLLDLSEPESIKTFVAAFQTKFSALDYLINNAGIMATDYKRNSKGWEMQIATNHMGHFILTGLLMPMLKKSKGRIVNHSSSYASASVIKFGQANSEHQGSKKMPMVNLTDWNWKDREYCPWAAYAQSKRANLYFTSELNRRYGADGVTATACHPGGSATGLQIKVDSEISVMVDALKSENIRNVFFSKPKDGALPQTYAALVADADAFVGPLWGLVGSPAVQGTSMHNLLSYMDTFSMMLAPRNYIRPTNPDGSRERTKGGYSANEALALWTASQQITGVDY